MKKSKAQQTLGKSKFKGLAQALNQSAKQAQVDKAAKIKSMKQK